MMEVVERGVFRMGVHVVLVDDNETGWLRVYNRTYDKRSKIPTGKIGTWIAYIRYWKRRQNGEAKAPGF